MNQYGTQKGGRERYFTCPEGRGIFIHPSKLVAKSKLPTSTSNIALANTANNIEENGQNESKINESRPISRASESRRTSSKSYADDQQNIPISKSISTPNFNKSATSITANPSTTAPIVNTNRTVSHHGASRRTSAELKSPVNITKKSFASNQPPIKPAFPRVNTDITATIPSPLNLNKYRTTIPIRKSPQSVTPQQQTRNSTSSTTTSILRSRPSSSTPTKTESTKSPVLTKPPSQSLPRSGILKYTSPVKGPPARSANTTPIIPVSSPSSKMSLRLRERSDSNHSIRLSQGSILGASKSSLGASQSSFGGLSHSPSFSNSNEPLAQRIAQARAKVTSLSLEVEEFGDDEDVSAMAELKQELSKLNSMPWTQDEAILKKELQTLDNMSRQESTVYELNSRIKELETICVGQTELITLMEAQAIEESARKSETKSQSTDRNTPQWSS